MLCRGRMTSRPEIVPVILVGGREKRLWPLASSRRPKAFLSLGTGLSFFQRTALRGRVFSAPIVVCHSRYGDEVLRQLAQIKMEPRAVILEPDFKGTAAAIAAAALMLRGQGVLMLVQPSDHVLESVRAFKKAVMESLAYTIENIVLFGVRPEAPEPDYGYIVAESGDGVCLSMRKFIEKPSLQDAASLIEREDCYWNTGMFLTRPSVFLELLARVAPHIHGGATQALNQGDEENVRVRLDRSFFSGIDFVSIDYALLKQISLPCVVRALDAGWSDVGSWRRLWRWWKRQDLFPKEISYKDER